MNVGVDILVIWQFAMENCCFFWIGKYQQTMDSIAMLVYPRVYQTGIVAES